jgi:hypothetical protein
LPCQGIAEASSASGARFWNPAAFRPRGQFHAMGLGGSRSTFGIKPAISSAAASSKTGGIRESWKLTPSETIAAAAQAAAQSTVQAQCPPGQSQGLPVSDDRSATVTSDLDSTEAFEFSATADNALFECSCANADGLPIAIARNAITGISQRKTRLHIGAA